MAVSEYGIWQIHLV